MGCMFPQYSMADPWTGPIRCFEDPLKGIYKFPSYKFETTTECDAVIFLYSSDNMYFTSNKLKVYPNPILNELTINTKENKTSNVEIFNQLGQKVYKNSFNNSTKIDFSNYSKGLYFVKVGMETIKVSKQ